MIHCKYIQTVNVEERELFKLKNYTGMRVYEYKLVVRTFKLEHFLTIPGENKQYCRHKHINYIKSGHDTLVCPRAV